MRGERGGCGGQILKKGRDMGKQQSALTIQEEKTGKAGSV